MEKPLLKHVSDIIDSGACGVLVADKKGLCVVAKGCAKSNSACLIKALSDQGSATEKNSSIKPLIVFETDSTSVLINSHEDYTTAIYRKKQ